VSHAKRATFGHSCAFSFCGLAQSRASRNWPSVSSAFPSSAPDNELSTTWEYEEIDAVLKTINRTTVQGSRDYALLATMVQHRRFASRRSRICRVCDLQLSKPFQVRLFGKGRKERYCPLWPQTAALVESILSATASGPAVRISPLSESPRSSINPFWNPPYPR